MRENWAFNNSTQVTRPGKVEEINKADQRDRKKGCRVEEQWLELKRGENEILSSAIGTQNNVNFSEYNERENFTRYNSDLRLLNLRTV